MGYSLACDLEQLNSKRTDSTAGGRGRIFTANRDTFWLKHTRSREFPPLRSPLQCRCLL